MTRAAFLARTESAAKSGGVVGFAEAPLLRLGGVQTIIPQAPLRSSKNVRSADFFAKFMLSLLGKILFLFTLLGVMAIVSMTARIFFIGLEDDKIISTGGNISYLAVYLFAALNAVVLYVWHTTKFFKSLIHFKHLVFITMICSLQGHYFLYAIEVAAESSRDPVMWSTLTQHMINVTISGITLDVFEGLQIAPFDLFCGFLKCDSTPITVIPGSPLAWLDAVHRSIATAIGLSYLSHLFRVAGNHSGSGEVSKHSE